MKKERNWGKLLEESWRGKGAIFGAREEVKVSREGTAARDLWAMEREKKLGPGRLRGLMGYLFVIGGGKWRFLLIILQLLIEGIEKNEN